MGQNNDDYDDYHNLAKRVKHAALLIQSSEQNTMILQMYIILFKINITWNRTTINKRAFLTELI